MAERQPSKLAIPSKNTNKTHNFERCAPIGAPKRLADKACNQIDPDLKSIVDAWLKLPPAIKTAILAMVRTVE